MHNTLVESLNTRNLTKYSKTIQSQRGVHLGRTADTFRQLCPSLPTVWVHQRPGLLPLQYRFRHCTTLDRRVQRKLGKLCSICFFPSATTGRECVRLRTNSTPPRSVVSPFSAALSFQEVQLAIRAEKSLQECKACTHTTTSNSHRETKLVDLLNFAPRSNGSKERVTSDARNLMQPSGRGVETTLILHVSMDHR